MSLCELTGSKKSKSKLKKYFIILDYKNSIESSSYKLFSLSLKVELPALIENEDSTHKENT